MAELKWTKHPILELPTRSQLSAMGAEQAFAFHERREALIAAEKADPFNYGFDHHNSDGHFQHWKDFDELLDDPSISTIWLFGGNRCIRGNTPIHDPSTGKETPVSEIIGDHTVLSWDGEKMVEARAREPFVKGWGGFLEVTLADGSSFEATSQHRVLLANGEWMCVGELEIGSELFLPSSARPSDSECAETPTRTVLSCLDRYSDGYCQYDGPPPEPLTSFQSSVPSQACAPGHRNRDCKPLDAILLEPGRSPRSSSFCHLSIVSGGGLLARQKGSLEYCSKPSRSLEPGALPCGQYRAQPVQEFQLETSSVSISSGSSQQANQSSCSLGVYIPKKVVSIKQSGGDFVWDFHVPIHNNYWACGAVHHNSGKTELLSKRLVQKMDEIPGYLVWVGGLSADSSIQVQQKAIHRYLPQTWTRQRRGVRQVNNIAFTLKNGFSNNTMVAPNKSQCWWKNYTIEQSKLEGANLDLIWLDELVPLPWIQTLKYRLIDRKGKMVMSFTPVAGYSPAVKEAMAGHVVTEYKDCDPEIIPGGRMPYKGRTRNGDAIMWFFSEDNPYIPWDHFKSTALSGKTKTEKEIRAYGYVRNPIIGKFPRFGDEHIISRDKIPTQGTNYMAVDPTGGDRNWFMVWVRVDDYGRKYVYREWPGSTHGEWAVPSNKMDGSPGPAQKADCGRNLTQYRELIRKLEKGETEPIIRYIDPRAGKSAIMSAKEANYSLIDHLSRDEISPDGNLKEAGMIFVPAAHTLIDEGVQAVNNDLSYDLDAPISALNEPKIYVSEECTNLIYALREWTNEDGDKGACKDPVDTLRYLISMEPCYVPPGRSYSSEGGYY